MLIMDFSAMCGEVRGFYFLPVIVLPHAGGADGLLHPGCFGRLFAELNQQPPRGERVVIGLAVLD